MAELHSIGWKWEYHGTYLMSTKTSSPWSERHHSSENLNSTLRKDERCLVF